VGKLALAQTTHYGYAPNYLGGYTVQQLGQPPISVTPNPFGGYTIQPLQQAPNFGGGYTIRQPPAEVNPFTGVNPFLSPPYAQQPCGQP
jgi:hypothetical protein